MYNICNGVVLLNRDIDIICKCRNHCIWYTIQLIHPYTKRYNVQFPEDLKANKTCKYFVNKILIKQDTEEIQDGGE